MKSLQRAAKRKMVFMVSFILLSSTNMQHIGSGHIEMIEMKSPPCFLFIGDITLALVHLSMDDKYVFFYFSTVGFSYASRICPHLSFLPF